MRKVEMTVEFVVSGHVTEDDVKALMYDRLIHSELQNSSTVAGRRLAEESLEENDDYFDISNVKFTQIDD